MSDYRYKEMSGLVRDCVYGVRKGMKGGWSEEIYHRVLVRVLEENGVPVASKPRRCLVHRGVEIYWFEADIIVWDKIVLELKCLPQQKEFVGENYGQIIRYLKFWGKDLGLLVNFGPSRAIVKRVIWDEPKFAVWEDYERIRDDLLEADKVALREIRKCILNLGQEYGLGYSESIYRKLVAVELNYQKISCLDELIVSAVWHEEEIGRQKTSHLLVADKYLIHVRAMLERPTSYDFFATKTYLKSLGLQFGLVLNFAQKELQIYGIMTD